MPCRKANPMKATKSKPATNSNHRIAVIALISRDCLAVSGHRNGLTARTVAAHLACPRGRAYDRLRRPAQLPAVRHCSHPGCGLSPLANVQPCRANQPHDVVMRLLDE